MLKPEWMRHFGTIDCEDVTLLGQRFCLNPVQEYLADALSDFQVCADRLVSGSLL